MTRQVQLKSCDPIRSEVSLFAFPIHTLREVMNWVARSTRGSLPKLRL